MKAFVNDRTAHAHVSKGTVCNFKRSYLRYDRFNATDDLKRSIIFTGLSFISFSKYSFYPYVFYSYVYILYLFFIQQSVKKFFFFFSIILVTRSSQVWPRSIAFSRQRFYNSFFTLLRNLLSVNEHTSQTSCSAVSRETGEGEACREWTCWRHEKNATLSTANVSNNRSNDSSDLSIHFLFIFCLF